MIGVIPRSPHANLLVQRPLAAAASESARPRKSYVAGIEQTPHWLACHLGDQVVVAVDVQYLEKRHQQGSSIAAMCPRVRAA